MFDVLADFPLQHDDDRSQDICNGNVIALIASLVLNGFVIDDISLYHMEAVCRNVVGLQILAHCHDRILVQIRTKYTSCTKLQCRNAKDTAAGSHIDHISFRSYVLAQLADAQLCRLMHTGSECSTRIDMKDHLIFVFFFYFFP